MERLRTLLEGKETSHILPFLWMKGEDNGTIAGELDRIEECGIREICLESRPHPDFCGPGWWENLDFICKEAKRRGMRLWILDDDKFPTGHANGGFERQPDKGKLYLAERHMDICGPCRNGAVLVENFMGVQGRDLKCPDRAVSGRKTSGDSGGAQARRGDPGSGRGGNSGPDGPL